MAAGKWPPVKNAAWRVTFPILDADGDLVTGASSPDSERSIDSGTFADCSNEATEIATSSGMYYLDLNASEMNGDTIAIIVKSGSGKTTPIVAYPVSGSFNEVYSDTTVLVPAASDIESALVVVLSDLAEVYSDTTILVPAASDIESALVVVLSDIAEVYSDTTILVPAASDIESSLVIVKSDLVVVESDTTAIESAASDIESSIVVIKSDIAEVYSDTTILVPAVSDVESSLVVVKLSLIHI